MERKDSSQFRTSELWLLYAAEKVAELKSRNVFRVDGFHVLICRRPISTRLEGLPENLCQCPHWGIVVKGSIHVTYANGIEETVNAGEVYYWPPGHTVKVAEDYEAIEFSPSDQMGE